MGCTFGLGGADVFNLGLPVTEFGLGDAGTALGLDAALVLGLGGTEAIGVVGFEGAVAFTNGLGGFDFLSAEGLGFAEASSVFRSPSFTS